MPPMSSLQSAFPDHPLPPSTSGFAEVENLVKATRVDSDGDPVGRCLVKLVDRSEEEVIEQMRKALSAAADQQVSAESQFRLMETDPQGARTVLVPVLSGHQAFSDFEMQCSAEQAAALVDAFIGCFHKDSLRLFTNVKFVGSKKSWSSALGHTYEAGVIAVDQASIGVLWVCDDD